VSLSSDEIHVWWTPLAGGPSDPRERRRHASERGRALVRRVLSKYASVAPDDWKFTVGEHGRPRVTSGDLDFNLAHSATLAIVAVARGTVGVDVEDLGAAPLDVAQRFFAPSEIAAIGDDSRRFYQHWVLKESYGKARGVGLRLPLDRIAFTLDGPPRISFAPPIDDDPARWWFALVEPTPLHLCAVAWRDPPAQPRLLVRQQIW
jgi:4'-phosphopantetheinyl transferase